MCSSDLAGPAAERVAKAIWGDSARPPAHPPTYLLARPPALAPAAAPARARTCTRPRLPAPAPRARTVRSHDEVCRQPQALSTLIMKIVERLRLLAPP